jgi:Kef-type K+ transport system membrane component KefB
MSLTTERRTAAPRFLTPGVAATGGFAVYATAVAAGEAFGLNADSGTAGLEAEHLVMALIAIVGAVVAAWVARRAWNSPPHRLARTSLALAVVAAATFLAFWAGWTTIFGAVAVGTALEHRRRVGSLSGSSGTALALGSLAFVAGTLTCLIG